MSIKLAELESISTAASKALQLSDWGFITLHPSGYKQKLSMFAADFSQNKKPKHVHVYLVNASGGEHSSSQGQRTVSLQQQTAERCLTAR